MAVALVVLANAGISAALARRGTSGARSPSSSSSSPCSTSAAAHLRGDRQRNGIDRGLALFFGYLLTMIIVLYDRFRAERITKLAALAPAR